MKYSINLVFLLVFIICACQQRDTNPFGRPANHSTIPFDKRIPHYVVGEDSLNFTIPNTAYIYEDHLYVHNSRSTSLIKLNEYGETVSVIGAKGYGPGEFTGVDAVIRIHSDSIYVMEIPRRIIQVFDMDGNYQRAVRLPKTSQNFEPLKDGFLINHLNEDLPLSVTDWNGNIRYSFGNERNTSGNAQFNPMNTRYMKVYGDVLAAAVASEPFVEFYKLSTGAFIRQDSVIVSEQIQSYHENLREVINETPTQEGTRSRRLSLAFNNVYFSETEFTGTKHLVDGGHILYRFKVDLNKPGLTHIATDTLSSQSILLWAYPVKNSYLGFSHVTGDLQRFAL